MTSRLFGFKDFSMNHLSLFGFCNIVLYICLTDEEKNIQKVRFAQGQAAVRDIKSQGWSPNNV